MGLTGAPYSHEGGATRLSMGEKERYRLTLIIDTCRRLSYDLWSTGGLIQWADNDWDRA